MASITVKIKKINSKTNEVNQKYAVYEVEPFNYGDHSYSLIKIEYQKESELEEFKEDKKVKIKVGEDMTKGEGNILIINGGTWNADRTVWQKFTDTTNDTTKKIGDASAAGVKKTGEGLKKAGDKLTESADKNKWPRWVYPIGIVLGLIILIGIIAWIFKPKK